MNSLSWKSALMVIALCSMVMAIELHTNKDLSIHRFKRGLFGPAYGLGFKSSILESLFGKGGVPFAPQPPAAQPPAVPQPTAPVTQPPPIFPPFLQNIMEAKKNFIAGKFAAKQPPAGSFTFEDVELAEDYVEPSTASKNNILASILKLSGPLSSSSSSVEYSDE